jgi:hypothetical protein
MLFYRLPISGKYPCLISVAFLSGNGGRFDTSGLQSEAQPVHHAKHTYKQYIKTILVFSYTLDTKLFAMGFLGHADRSRLVDAFGQHHPLKFGRRPVFNGFLGRAGKKQHSDAETNGSGFEPGHGIASCQKFRLSSGTGATRNVQTYLNKEPELNSTKPFNK